MNDTAWWWSWLLTAVGLTGFYLAGRKIWWCWYVNIACQFLWLAYAIVTEQYGFIVASIAYFIVFSRNAYKWTREHARDLNLDLNKFALHPNTLAEMERIRGDRRFDDDWEPEPEKEHWEDKLEWAKSEEALGYLICWYSGNPHHYSPTQYGRALCYYGVGHIVINEDDYFRGNLPAEVVAEWVHWRRDDRKDARER